MSDNGHTQAVSANANSRVLSDFLDYLKIEKGLAGLTISAYQRDLLQFDEFLGHGKRNLLNTEVVRDGKTIAGVLWLAEAMRRGELA